MKFPQIKIVGDGEIGKALSFTGVGVSKSATAAIMKAGGSVVPLFPPKKPKHVHVKPAKDAGKKAGGKKK